MPHFTRADNGTTFLHILHEIFDLDVGHPLALALDDCGIATVKDLLTMTQETIASLKYPTALTSYGTVERAVRTTQELECMPLKLAHKNLLEWFTQWAYALYRANNSVPLSDVAWHSMTAEDFEHYCASQGTYTPIIRASPCITMSPTTSQAAHPLVDCCPFPMTSRAFSASQMSSDFPLFATLETDLATLAIITATLAFTATIYATVTNQSCHRHPGLPRIAGL